jgi:hypothetical protein
MNTQTNKPGSEATYADLSHRQRSTALYRGQVTVTGYTWEDMR